MGTRALMFAAALAASDRVHALDSPESTGSSCCATIAPGWMLFEDRSGTVPDCWRLGRIQVDEISICDHAVQFLFIADERGSPHLTALVFPRPSTRLVETRLQLSPGHPEFAPTLASLEQHYADLLANLARASGGRLVSRTRMRFHGLPVTEHPFIEDPTPRLGFTWNGQDFLLRGYLDVYLTLLS